MKKNLSELKKTSPQWRIEQNRTEQNDGIPFQCSHKLRLKVNKPRVKARKFTVRLQLQVKGKQSKKKKNFLKRYDVSKFLCYVSK